MSSRVIQCYLNSDLRNGHEGLTALAKKNGIHTGKLEAGQYVVFINSRKDRLKLYAANNVVAYLKLEDGRKIDLNTIRLIPQVFNGSGKIDYDRALRETLETALRLKRSPALEIVRRAAG